MNMDKLKDMLRPWMAIDTWHTPHPCDEERFHKVLKSIFDEMGTNVDGADFQAVMQDLADEYHPAWDQGHKDKLTLSFAIKAETIGSYLYDTK